MSLINDMYGFRGGSNGAGLGLVIAGILAIGGVIQIAALPPTWKENKKSQAALWLMGLIAGLAGGIAASYYTWHPLFDSLHRYGMDPEIFGMSETAANWYAGGITFGVVAIMTGTAWNLGGFIGYTMGEKLNQLIEHCQRELSSINADEHQPLKAPPARTRGVTMA